jgi:hypothetical protein
MNSKLKDATDMAESGCGKLDDVGVVARVDQPFSKAEGSGLVPLPLVDRVVRLRECFFIRLQCEVLANRRRQIRQLATRLEDIREVTHTMEHDMAQCHRPGGGLL